MLSSGCIPVVNDAEQNRMVLDNEHVRYARATPFDLAAALGALVTGRGRPPSGRGPPPPRASPGRGWSGAGDQVERIIIDAVAARQPVAQA